MYNYTGEVGLPLANFKTIHHGKWLYYRPKVIPNWAVPNAIFAKREEDGMDWYEYIHRGNHFQKDSVKVAIMYMSAVESWVGMVAVYEPDRIYPADQMLLEITDFKGDNPQEFFGRRVYNPETEEWGKLAWGEELNASN